MIKEVFLEWTVKVFAIWCEARGNITSCGVDLSVNFDLPFWIPKTTHIISWNIHDYDIYCINNIVIYQLIYSVYIYIINFHHIIVELRTPAMPVGVGGKMYKRLILRIFLNSYYSSITTQKLFTKKTITTNHNYLIHS